MNKRTKYSTVIVAALLACAPIVMSNTVKADTQGKITNNTDNKSKQEKQGEIDKKTGDDASKQSEISKKTSDGTSKQSETGNKVNKLDTKKSDDNPFYDDDFLDGDDDPLAKEHEKPISDKHITNAKLLTTKWDKSEIKVKWRPDLTSNDLYHYLYHLSEKYGHLYANDEEIKNFDPGFAGSYSSKINENSTKIIPKGIYVYLDIHISQGLQPNTWYQWQLEDVYRSYEDFESGNSDDWVKIPKTITDRVSNHILPDDDNLVSVKTDAKGNLPVLGNDLISYDYDAIDDPTQSGTKVVVSTDNDALDVPRANVNVTKPKPITDNPGFYYYPSIDNSAVKPDTIKDTNKVQNNRPVDDAIKTSDDNTGDTLNVTSSAKPLMLKHHAFVYTKTGKTGKIARTKDHTYILWLAYHNVKPLDNGKIYKIKGKKFYRVGKNKYIKVANTTVRPKITKVNIEGTVKSHKGSKRVRLYDVNGKFVKKFVAKGKKLSFNAKRRIHNRMYYQIKGTKLWIRASKVKTNK